MKKTKKRALYVIAALLGALFVLSCLVGFAACGGGSNESDGDTASVSSVSVTPTTLSLGLGDEDSKTGSVTATVTMSDGSDYDGDYTWSSSATSYATVSGSGKTATVTAVADGTSNITVTAGGVTSNACVVTVKTTGGDENPSGGDENPSGGDENPSGGDENPSGGDENPGTEPEEPETEATQVSTADELATALQQGGEIDLAAGIEITTALEVKADTTIDLAGSTLSTGSSWALPADDSTGFRSDALITVESGATLTVTDSGTGTTSGTISYDVTGTAINKPNSQDTYAWNSSVNYGAAIEVAEGGSLVVEGGTISSSSVGVRAEGVTANSSDRATVTISGGTIESMYFSIWASGDADVTIAEGATISGTNKGICIGGDSNFGYSTYQDGVTTLTITGGEISCENDSAICTLGVGSAKSAVITISGGTITGATELTYTDESRTTVKTTYPAVYIPSGTLTISGGSITGITAVEIRGGTASITGGTLATSFTGTPGVIANSSGATSYGYQFCVNPYGVTNRSELGDYSESISVTVAASVITDEGTSTTSGLYVSNNLTTATASDGTFKIAKMTAVSDLSTLSQALTNGGKIALTPTASGSGSGSESGEIDVTSSLTVSADTELDLMGNTLSTGTSLSSSMNTIEVSANATLTITDSSADGEGTIANTYTGSEEKGNTSTDNAAAIAVAEGGTLVIESGTITSTSVGVRAEGVDSNTSGTRAIVTIDGGTIESTYFSIFASGDADVTINDGTISGKDKGICIGGDSNYGYDTYQTGTKTTLTITGGEVSCESDSAICTLGVGSNASAEITISGGTITSSATPVIDQETQQVTTSCPAIYLPTGTLTITGGTISGTTAVEVRGGKVSISGGTLVCLSYDEDGNIVQGDDASQSKSGAKTYGYALSVYPYGKVSRTGYQESDNAVDVTVTGGTFDGDIYVAAQSQNAGSDGSKWQVKLNDSTSTETDKYVVTISFTDTTITVETVAYDANGKIEEADIESSTPTYYIVTVSAAVSA